MMNSKIIDFVCNGNPKFETGHHPYIENVIKFLNADLTVPFIARYRKTEIGGMDAETIRQIQQAYGNFKKIESKIQVVLKKIGNVAPKEVIESIRQAQSIEEIEELYFPFKKGGKRSLADRARNLGLDKVVFDMLEAPSTPVPFRRIMNSNVEGLTLEADVTTGMQHVLADLIAKDLLMKEKLKEEVQRRYVWLTTKAASNAQQIDKTGKFSNYYKFQSTVDRLKVHQVLGINRAEQLKIVSVKVEIVEHKRQKILQWIKNKWIPKNATVKNRKIILNAIEDSFKRLIEKTFVRHLRVKLTKEAELEAIGYFSRNLKQLLLVAPVRDKNILSIDPGFRNGCKIAVLGKNGNVLETAVIYPFCSKTKEEDAGRLVIIELAKKHMVDIVAIGNATACRETEALISDMIKKGNFKPLEISYSIVDEAGSSIYSVTKEAKEEFGDLDPNLISSVSIGRRLQDPLLEIVKTEAKHIGVGMYQHDIDKILLQFATNDVIEDCVSFVGLDLNACSAILLRRIAGISKKQADSIITYREKNGPFINRQELQLVDGIGKVTFKNCAGFLRIIPKSKDDSETVDFEQEVSVIEGRKRKMRQGTTVLQSKKKRLLNKNHLKVEVLDQTNIHPEYYHLSYKIIDYLGCAVSEVGTNEMAIKVNTVLGKNSYIDLSEKFNTDEHTVKLILDGLQQSLDYDLRAESENPIFKTGLNYIEDLRESQSVTGVVRNTTSFGVFVDIGMNSCALIHQTPLDVHLGPGDRVECTVVNVELKRERVQLRLVRKLSKDIILR